MRGFSATLRAMAQKQGIKPIDALTRAFKGTPILSVTKN